MNALIKHFFLPVLLVLTPAIGLANMPSLEQAKLKLLQQYGVAVMVADRTDNAIPANSPLYSLLIGKLQREIRKADFVVFNAVLPADRNSAQFNTDTNTDTLAEVIAALDNPYIDTILMLDVRVIDAAGTGQPEAVALTLEFVDAETARAFAALDKYFKLEPSVHCQSDCLNRQVNRQFIQMAQQLSADAVSMMRVDADSSVYAQVSH